MKRWAYITGVIFLVLLLVFTGMKFTDRAMPAWLFYAFCIAAFLFFFVLVFAAFQQRKKTDENRH